MGIDYSNAKHNLEGEIGEKVAFLHFQKNDKIINVKDVRSAAEYQKIDVDFVVDMITEGKNRKIKVEVKTDIAAGKYGNFFIEKEIHYPDTEMIIKKGWIDYSECDYFFIYVPRHKITYVFQPFKIKEYIEKYNPPLKKCNDGYKMVYGYCVNIDDFCSRYYVREIENVDTKEVG